MKQILHQFRGWITLKRLLSVQSLKQYSVALVVVVGLTVYAQATPTFADPDAFYHARISAEIWQNGIQHTLPALPFSSWGNHFTDQHLLYHLLIAPLTAYTDPLVATKIVHVLLVTVLVVIAVWFIRAMRLPHAGLAVILIFLASPFFTRLQIIKATPLALTLFIITLAAISLRRPWLVFFASWIYVYAHGGYVLAIVTAGMFWLGHTIANSIKNNRLHIASPAYSILVVLGITGGMVVNPYFPANFLFMWEQFVQIGLVNYSSVIGVGSEWYAYRPSDLAQGISVLLVFFVMTCSIIAYKRHSYKYDGWLWSMALYSVFLVLITLRSKRYVEYLVPVIGFMIAYVVLPYIQSGEWRDAWQRVGKKLGVWRGVISVYVITMMVVSLSYQTALVIKSIRTSELTWDAYSQPMHELVEIVPPGTQVFHVRWDAFPQMYYLAPQLRYISGLDATFLYRYNSQLYEVWDAIGKGEVRDPAKKIHEVFNADYIVIKKLDSKQRLLDAWLLRDPNAKVIIERNDIRIYQIL